MRLCAICSCGCVGQELTESAAVDFEDFWCYIYVSFCEKLGMRGCGNMSGVISLAKLYPNVFLFDFIDNCLGRTGEPRWEAATPSYIIQYMD